MSKRFIKKLHHAAYRCQNSEITRQFYEGFLRLPLSGALEINKTKTGRKTSVLHTFYELKDKSYLAFFEDPNQPFDFKNQHDFDLHIALEVEEKDLLKMIREANDNNIEIRGISDHNFISSIYLRDPNGYVVELTSKNSNHGEHLFPDNKSARDILNNWSNNKR